MNCGYAADPNDSSNNDPNCARSDFDGDGAVDLADMAVFADNWLRPVFDEYHVCSLCNLHTAGDPNDPNAGAGADIIDSRDYDALMADWGKQGYTGCSVSFRNEQDISLEPNNLSDEVIMLADNYPPSTILIFAQVDGRSAGSAYLNSMVPTEITIPTNEFGNGCHTVTIGGYTSNGGCWLENVRVQFQNSLYFVSIPDKYEPNQPLGFSAFNDGEDVSVKVYADCGNLVWSQTYSGNSISYSIPSGITGQHEIDYINFDKNDGTSILKIADPSDICPSFDVKALIILPDRRIRINNFRSTWAVQTAFKNRGIKYKKLGCKSANYDDIAWYAKTNPIKYIYVDGHGGFGQDSSSGQYIFKQGALRTCVALSDGIAVSMKQSDFPIGQAPSYCESLGSYWEKRANSFFSMGFNGLEFAYFNCCDSGKLKINEYGYLVVGDSGQKGLVIDGPHSDMSIALGMDNATKSCVYQGWYGEIITRFPQIWPYETEDQKWTRLEWERLGAGDNLYDALMYTIGQQTEFGPDDPVNNYRLKGQGLFTDIRLRSN